MKLPSRFNWSFWIRLIFTVGIGVYLYTQIDWSGFGKLVAQAQPGWAFLACGCYALTAFLGICRWHLLLKNCHATMKWIRTAQLTFIGLFANLFLPSSMGGDVLKAFYASREIPHIKPTVIMSIIMERLLGFVAMFLISTALICTRLEALASEPATRIAIILYFCFFGLVLLVILAGAWKRLGNLIPWWRRLPIESQLREAGEAYRFFLGHPGCFFGGLGLSCFAHFSLMSTFYCVSISLNMGIHFWDLAAVLPLIMVVSMIPITPNGVGLRELAFAHFLQFAQMTEEASVALSLGGTAVIYLFALAGGIVYLQFRQQQPTPAVAAVGPSDADVESQVESPERSR